MNFYSNKIYVKISQYLINRGYNPIFLTNKENNTEMLLFIAYSENIIFSISFDKIDNTLYLLEGSLFKQNNNSHHISCGFYRACSIPCNFHINTDKLISQFKRSFKQFILDGIEFKIDDNNVIYPEMKSGIVFENPEYAVTQFAKQHKWKIKKVSDIKK